MTKKLFKVNNLLKSKNFFTRSGHKVINMKIKIGYWTSDDRVAVLEGKIIDPNSGRSISLVWFLTGKCCEVRGDYYNNASDYNLIYSLRNKVYETIKTTKYKE